MTGTPRNSACFSVRLRWIDSARRREMGPATRRGPQPLQRGHNPLLINDGVSSRAFSDAQPASFMRQGSNASQSSAVSQGPSIAV